MRRFILVSMAVLCLLLSGCAMLEKEYSVVEPHTDRYWESPTGDILRAESYQDLVNTTLLLVEEHEPDGIIRLYLSEKDYDTAWSLVYDACREVRTQTAVGAYVLRALDFDMQQLLDSYYEVQIRPTYRHSAEEVAAIAEIASSSAIYDMVLQAWENGLDDLAIRCSYLSEDKETLRENLLLLQQDLEAPPAIEEEVLPPSGQKEPPADADTPPVSDGAAAPEGEDAPVDGEIAEPPVDPPADLTPWEINFYPPNSSSSIIIEVSFR